MIVLDLFAGLGGWSAAFKDIPHPLRVVPSDVRADGGMDGRDIEPRKVGGVAVSLRNTDYQKEEK